MRKTDVILYDAAAKICQFDVTSVCTNIVWNVTSSVLKQRFYISNIQKKTNWCSMQEKARIFKSSCWCYSRFLIHFSIRKKWPILFLRIPILQSKQVLLIRSALTYLRCMADQTRSKYDQPTLYRRPPCCIPAQHTTCGERDHPRPFFNRLKNLSRSPRPLRAGPTNPRCILDQHTLSPIKARSLPIRQFFQSGGWSGLWCERAFSRSICSYKSLFV